MSSRRMSLLPRATLHSDSEHYPLPPTPNVSSTIIYTYSSLSPFPSLRISLYCTQHSPGLSYLPYLPLLILLIHPPPTSPTTPPFLLLVPLSLPRYYLCPNLCCYQFLHSYYSRFPINLLLPFPPPPPLPPPPPPPPHRYLNLIIPLPLPFCNAPLFATPADPATDTRCLHPC